MTSQENNLENEENAAVSVPLIGTEECSQENGGDIIALINVVESQSQNNEERASYEEDTFSQSQGQEDDEVLRDSQFSQGSAYSLGSLSQYYDLPTRSPNCPQSDSQTSTFDELSETSLFGFGGVSQEQEEDEV